jgi:hypothetical protein
MQINLTKRQINFLASFEATYGRPATVDRKTLVAFKETWTNGQTGSLGYPLRWPAWLTNSGTFTATRGNYNLPWEAYDQWWATANANAAAPAAVA